MHLLSHLLYDQTWPANDLCTFYDPCSQDPCLGCWLSIPGPQLKNWSPLHVEEIRLMRFLHCSYKHSSWLRKALGFGSTSAMQREFFEEQRQKE